MIDDPDTPEAQNPRLAESIQTAEKNWLPVNQVVMIQIRKYLQHDEYSIDDLIKDITADPCLFLYCVRELLKEEETASYPNHLFKLLEDADKVGLSKLLDGPTFQLLTYSGQSARELQKEIIAYVINCATAAEIFAEEFAVDTDQAFATSLLTHTGLLLLAWNEADRLAASIKLVENKRYSFHDATIRTFGFSLDAFTLRILERMHTGDDILLTITNALTHSTNNDLDLNESIQAVLDIATTFGRSQAPSLYPDGVSNWEAARLRIVEGLGEEPAYRLERRIIRRLQRFSFTGFIEPAEEDSDHYGLTLAEQNQYIRRCPDVLRKELYACYEDVESPGLTQSALNRLTKQVLPGLQFRNGAIYFLDESNQTLKARLQIGDRGMELFPTMSITQELDADNPVLAGFYSRFPTIQMNTLSETQGLSSISASFRTSNGSGVLYLEVDTDSHLVEQIDTLTIFKAVTRLIEHCHGA